MALDVGYRTQSGDAWFMGTTTFTYEIARRSRRSRGLFEDHFGQRCLIWGIGLDPVTLRETGCAQREEEGTRDRVMANTHLDRGKAIGRHSGRSL